MFSSLSSLWQNYWLLACEHWFVLVVSCFVLLFVSVLVVHVMSDKEKRVMFR